MQEFSTPRESRDRPWLIRTYSGHSSASASNALYKKNMVRGQTGLSVAFDLPTQTGYDPDHVLARGEVGKVGVPISHLGDMRALFDGIPLDEMNTSMTINATAPWLLALYIAVAEEQDVDPAALKGTVQNDIVKEYLSRGTHIFPPEPSMKLMTDVITYCADALPKWNPTNVCSYHLQEAGATPVQELAYALATAIAVLDSVKASGVIPRKDFPAVVGRISFFVNAGIRFVTEMCKMRAFAELWDAICRDRYGIADPKFRRFRYGVQVNSLGLTEQQPENNVYRILLEMLAVTLSKNARARAVQLPAWNEALGLPREWDQQWSLRLQQIVAHETDLLEFGDLFDGSPVIDAKVAELETGAMALLNEIEAAGGMLACVEDGSLKRALVAENAARVRAIEAGEQTVVGVNAFTETAPSPLSTGQADILKVDESVELEQVAALNEWRAARDNGAVEAALASLETAAKDGTNIMPASIECAKAGVTTGEWAATLRGVFGEYRAPTGVVVSETDTEALATLRGRVAAVEKKLGDELRFLVAKPGLDGHSNGAEQIAVAAGEAGITTIYDGIRTTPEEIVAKAKAENVHVLGLSILSGSHVNLIQDVMGRLRAEGLNIPVIVGGIIPDEDAEILKQTGIARVYTPKDYEVTGIIGDIVEVVGSKQPEPRIDILPR